MEAQEKAIRLGTMGMFILDTFRFIDAVDGRDLGDKGMEEQIGGGGCYFAIGARMWLEPDQIQMIIDRGCDWRLQHQEVLNRYDQTPYPRGPSSRSMWHFRTRPDGTTRALNLYTGDQRGFEYLSPKIRLDPIDLLQSSPLTPPRLPDWIHLICSPERALEAFADMRSICRQNGQLFPKIVYEPIPDSCVPESLALCLKALESVTVFSPNHEEAASLLKLTSEWEAILKSSPSQTETYLLDFIEQKLATGFARLWAERHGANQSTAGSSGPIICIRSGAWGSVVGRDGDSFARVPAWHSDSAGSPVDRSSDKIVDVTGAGNAFLGGFAASLIKNESNDSLSDHARMREAALYGAVSASLVIEQLGLPAYSVQEGTELWNCQTVVSRLASLSGTFSGSIRN